MICVFIVITLWNAVLLRAVSFRVKRNVVRQLLSKRRSYLIRAYACKRLHAVALDDGAGNFVNEILADASIAHCNSLPSRVCTLGDKIAYCKSERAVLGRYFLVEYDDLSMHVFYLNFGEMHDAWFELPRCHYVFTTDYEIARREILEPYLSVANEADRLALVDRFESLLLSEKLRAARLSTQPSTTHYL